MEQRFFRDDFEHFLRDSANEFRMYPSKRVWSSLYNNFHPARKWPSIAVWFLLITSMIYIGVAHQDDRHVLVSQQENTVSQSAVVASRLNADDVKMEEKFGPNVVLTPTFRDFVAENAEIERITPSSVPLFTERRKMTGLRPATSGVPSNDRRLSQIAVLTPTAPAEISPVFPGNTRYSQENERLSIGSADFRIENKKDKENLLVTEQGLQRKLLDVEVRYRAANQPKLKSFVLYSATQAGKELDKEWIEDHAFHNQPRTSFRAKAQDQFYVTPSVGYRTMIKNTGLASPPGARNNAYQGEDPALRQIPALNLEAGYNFLYPYSKLLRLKAGIQLNYSRFRTKAYRQDETSLTNLLLNDEHSGGIKLEQRGTILSNVPGMGKATRLNNGNMQVSMPFGADLKIAGRHDLKWFVGATMQPTYVLFGNAYLISSDNQNFVLDANLLRKWNMNTAVETFISYEGRNGVIFQAGPQFRYQVLSTYSRLYSYSERLYNLGLKVSVVKNF